MIEKVYFLSYISDKLKDTNKANIYLNKQEKLISQKFGAFDIILTLQNVGPYLVSGELCSRSREPRTASAIRGMEMSRREWVRAETPFVLMNNSLFTTPAKEISRDRTSNKVGR